MSTQKLKEIHIGSYDRVRNNVDKILKALDTHGTVIISGLRRAIRKSIDTVESLCSRGLCSITDIRTSQVKSSGEGNKARSSRIEITITKTDKFEEIMKAKFELDQERKKIRDEVNKGKQRVQEKYLKAQEAH